MNCEVAYYDFAIAYYRIKVIKRLNMDVPYWIFIVWALLITAPVLVQAQTNAQQSSDESDADWGESNSFIGHKTKIIIIVVSVVAGVVVIFSG